MLYLVYDLVILPVTTGQPIVRQKHSRATLTFYYFSKCKLRRDKNMLFYQVSI